MSVLTKMGKLRFGLNQNKIRIETGMMSLSRIAKHATNQELEVVSQ